MRDLIEFIFQKKASAEVADANSKKEQTCAANGIAAKNGDDVGNRLDPLDMTISTEQQEQFRVWAEHDDALQDRYCDVDGK